MQAYKEDLKNMRDVPRQKIKPRSGKDKKITQPKKQPASKEDKQ